MKYSKKFLKSIFNKKSKDKFFDIKIIEAYYQEYIPKKRASRDKYVNL